MSARARLASNRSPRWAFMERFEVPDYDYPLRNYLTRWRLIQTPWAAVYLHRMDGPDPRMTLHDHPWSFLSIILSGGYVEHFGLGRDVRSWRAGSLHRMRAEDAHAITHLHGDRTWTLLLVGRRRREWGYVEADGTWTRFDLHPHAIEFDRALAARKAAS